MPFVDTAHRTRAELDAGVVRALGESWRYINWSHFGSLMRAPVISLIEGTTTLGRWVPATRELHVQRDLVYDQPWTAVEEVLKHEMAHQFVWEVLRHTDETAHGPAFRRVCEERGIDPSASGLPVTQAGDAGQRVIGRVHKLLALASSANQHEAETAMAKAQALMQAHNVEVVRSRQPRRYGFRQLGTPKGRIYEPERRLAALLSEHFFVDVIWTSAYLPERQMTGSVIEASGTPENLAIAEYVHGFLLDTAERLWRAHKKTSGIKGDRDRRRFLAGVMRGFHEKLDRQRAHGEEKGLVWVGDGDLARYAKKRHPRTQRVQRQGAGRNAAFAAGREAGQSIVLNKPVGGESKNRGRLLGPGG